MSSPSHSKAPSSGLSNFLPRFKLREGSSTLSPTKASSSPSQSSSRRASVSDIAVPAMVSPTASQSSVPAPAPSSSSSPSTAHRKPSPALSSKSSFSDFSWGRSRETSQASDATAKALPPKLTLTAEGVDGDMISLHAPSPIATAPTDSLASGRLHPATADVIPTARLGLGDGLPRGWSEDDSDDLRTPTGEESALDRSYPIPSNDNDPPPDRAPSPSPSSDSRAPSLSDVPRSRPHSKSLSSSSRSQLSSDSRSHSGSVVQHHQGSSSSSLAAPSLTNGDDSHSTSSGSRFRRRRGSSAASKKVKASSGIAGAIAGMSRDLVNPAHGILVPASSSSSQSTPRPHSPPYVGLTQAHTRGRSGTGDLSLADSSSSNASSRRRRSSISIRDKLRQSAPSSPSASSALLAPTRVQSDARTSIDDDMRPSLGPEGDYSQSDSYDEYGDEVGDGSASDESGDDEGGFYGLPAVTGFAVASQKRNADFHALFGKSVPEDDYLIEDYGCALQRDILLQGRLYVSEHHVCFHANIFGWITNLVIAFSEIHRIDKKMTAFVIPNAIMISTRDSKHNFASFLSRDTTYDVVHNIWRISHPSVPNSPSSEFLTSPSSHDLPVSNDNPSSGEHLAGSRSPTKKSHVTRKATQCACGRMGQHYTETAMDAVFPSTPEKIYNLMFTSGFVKSFMSENQKLMDIQISDWAPASSGSNLLTRTSSYIKPLAGGFGPKQTKCELEDVTAHADFDDYVSMITTTRTPDVPSGGVFSVKTRTCLMWASAGSTRVLVTTEVQWTGRSFIKGIIDSSALAGQKSTHAALETAVRTYIADHLTEFQVEGADDEVPEDEQPSSVVASPNNPQAGSSPAALPTSTGEKLSQKAVDDGTFFQYGVDSLTKGLAQLFKGIQVIIESLFGSLGVHGAFGVIVFLLLLSNIWTYTSLQGARDPAGGPRLAPRTPILRSTRGSDKQVSAESVADAVRGFLEDYFDKQPGIIASSIAQDARVVPTEELVAISAAIDALETRLITLRNRLLPESPTLQP